MDINKVSLVIGEHKKDLSFIYDSLQIKIRLNKPYNNNEEFLIYIDIGF